MIDTTYFGLPWQLLVILLKKLEIVKLIILGLNKTTLLDYPEKIAATIFTGGCNFRCPYCHNSQLIVPPFDGESISVKEVFDFLNKRKNILQGVCISGGEPTIQNDLPEFIGKIKDMGYLVKLDTNGTNPQMLSMLIQDGFVDYVAMDIKNSKCKYEQTAQCTQKDIELIDQSISILKTSNIDYEFRTTIVKELHSKEDISKIYNWIKGCKAWYLQSYKESENVMNKIFSSYNEDEIKNILDMINDSNVYERKS